MAGPFWVIFDTSQYPDYYRDVHNLLAYPRSATMRYDYKEKYLSPSAIEHAAKNEPMSILFVYTQKKGPYTREEGRSAASPGINDVLYVATRFGTMLNVARTGETFYFDFQLAGYPISDSKILDAILSPLRARSEVPWGAEKDSSPYGKWLSVSHDTASYEGLSAGDDQANWTAIVNRMLAAPVQFASDSFWRLKGPYKYGGDVVRDPEIIYETESGQTRKAEAVYNFPENGLWRFEVISEVGKGTGTRPQYYVDVTSTDEKVMKPIGGTHVGLRRSTGEMINFRTETAALIGRTLVHFLLVTQPQPASWVVGPNLVFKFRVHRNRVRVWLGILFGILGPLAYVIGDSDALKTQHPWWAACVKFCGIIEVAVSAFFLTGKITFEAK